MRIFLSYGHDEHAGFAVRLKSDLEERGHEVWFAEHQLKPGADWELHIEEGLDWASEKFGKFLLLLTPHSVRRPDGYCLNEMARACSPSRKLTIIPLMVSTVEPPLSICRIQWLDFRHCIPVEQHPARYGTQFEKLLDAIEHNHLNFEGAQARLLSALQPVEYDEASRHIARFTGRSWVIREVEGWLASGRRVLWITGDAGIGKTALAAWLCDRRPEILGAHYFRYGNANRSERKALLSLAWQLSTQLPEYQRRLNAADLDMIRAETNLRGLFDRLFVETFSHHFPMPTRRVVLLIDGLDETTDKGSNEFASLIGMDWNRTPEWLRLIVTSRPHESEINVPLQSLDPWMIDARREENLEDIRTYLRRELRGLAGNQEPRKAIVEAILEKSEGLFLYVWWVCEEIQAGRLSLTNAETFPRGLGGIYNEYFKRNFPDIREYKEHWRPVIETICAAYQPLPVEEFTLLFPEFYDPSEITRGLGSLFPDSGGRIRLFHQSVRDWITQADRAGSYIVRVDQGHKRLADGGWHQYQGDTPVLLEQRMSPYFVIHLPAHLKACDRKSDLRQVLLDADWIQTKLKRSDVVALLADYEYVKEDEPCTLVRDAIQLSAHVISTHPEEFASQLLGRLLPHREYPTMSRFMHGIAKHAPEPWLRPLHPALHPSGAPLLRTVELEGAGINLAVTPDGKRAVSVSDGKAKVLDLESGRVLRMLEGRVSARNGIAVTANGKRAFSASDNKTLKVWDLDTGHTVRTLKSPVDVGPFPSGVAVTPDGKLVSTSGEKLMVWDMETGRILRTLEGHRSAGICVAVTLDGKRAVSGSSSDKTLRVWDLETGLALHILETQPIFAVTVTPDGTRAITVEEIFESGKARPTLRVWNLETGEVLRSLESPPVDFIFAVAVTSDSKRVVSANRDHALSVWDLDTGRKLFVLESHTKEVLRVVTVGNRAVSASWDKTLKVWDLDRTLPSLDRHADSVTSIATTPDGKRAISTSRDRTLKVWDLETGRVLLTLEGHNGPIYHVAITPDGIRAVSASVDKTLKVWDLTTGRVLHTLEGHSGTVTSVALTRDGERAISASRDKTLKVWDLETGDALRTLEGHSGFVHCVALTPYGMRAVSGSVDQKLKVWDLENGILMHTLEGHKGTVGCVAVTPDGTRAVSGSVDQKLKVWDLENGILLRTLEGHGGPVGCVVVTPDGKRLVSGSSMDWDKTLKVWNVESGLVLSTLEGHADRITGVAVTPDGARAVSTSDDKTLKVWNLNSGLCVATFHCDSRANCCALIEGHRIVAGDEGGGVYILSLVSRLANQFD